MLAVPIRRKRVLGLLAVLAWIGVAWAFWLAHSVRPRQTLPLGLPNYSFPEVLAGSPIAVLNPTRDELSLLNPATGRKQITLQGDLGEVSGVMTGRNPDTLATFDSAYKYTIWHKDGNDAWNRFSLPERVHMLTCSPDGNFVATSIIIKHEPKVRIWDVPSHKAVATLDGAVGRGFHPDSRTVGTMTDEGAKLWDLTTGRPQLTLREDFYEIAISPDGRLLATFSGDRRVTLWDCSTGQAQATYHVPGVFGEMFFSPDSSRVGHTVFHYSHPLFEKLVDWLGYARDFRRSLESGEVIVFDAATGLECARVPLAGGHVLFVDEKTLATLTRAKDALQLWDLPPRRALHPLMAWACLGVAVVLTGAWCLARRSVFSRTPGSSLQG